MERCIMIEENSVSIEDKAMGHNQVRTNAIALMTAVNFAEMKISNNSVETLVAFSIGSGIGLTIHDPVCGVGGVLHFMLPDSTLANGVNPEKVPFMFADTGVPTFLKALVAQGTQPDKMKVVVAGGAQVLDQAGIFNIGQKNYEALKRILERYDLSIQHESIGGTSSRTLSLAIESGCSSIKIFGQGEKKV
jgi:chemotaxis protein CheD